jgi:SPP1 gp7 family putative phage head morphogenesis protein
VSQLVDQFGQPIKPAQLTAPMRPDQTLTTQRRLWRQATIEPTEVFNAVMRAEIGETVYLQDLLFRISFDSRVTSDSEKRVGKLELVDFGVSPFETPADPANDREQMIADFCAEAIDRIPNFGGARAHLGGGRLYGWRVCEMRWDHRTSKGTKWLLPVELRERRTRDFRPNPADHSQFQRWVGLGSQIVENQKPLNPQTFGWAPLEPARYLVNWFTNDGSAMLAGLYIKLVFPVLAINWTLTQWGELLELFGKGSADVTYDAVKGGEQNTANAIAEGSGTPLWTAMNSAYSIKREIMTGRATHADFHDRAKKAVSEVLLGSQLTTDQGTVGSQALGNVHAQELDDLRARDAKHLAECCLTEQLVKAIVIINFGPQERYPYAWLNYKKPADLKLEMATDTGLHQIGVPLSKSDTYQRYNRQPPSGPDDTLAPGNNTNAAAAAAAENNGGAGGQTFVARPAPRRFSAGNDGGGDGDTAAPDEILALDARLQSEAIAAIEDAPSLTAAEAALRDLMAAVEISHTGRVAYELYRVQALAHLAGIWSDMRDHGETPARPRSALWLPHRARLARLCKLGDLRADGLASVSGRAFATVIDEWADVPMQEAIDYFERKGIVSADEWAALDDAYKHRGFFAAKIGTGEELKTAYDAINNALKTGAARDSVVRDLRAKLANPPSTSYLRFLFDENVGTAQAFGRYARQEKTKADRPYGRYVTMGDGRVRARHAAAHGVVKHLDHPWWQRNTPKNGYRCRCERNTYTAADLAAHGWSETPGTPPDVCDPGFMHTMSAAAGADERLNALVAQSHEDGLLSGYDVPAIITFGSDKGRPIIVGQRKAQ